jgi:hypothetical protein
MKRLLLAAVAAITFMTSAYATSAENKEFLQGYFAFWVYDRNCKPEKPYFNDPVLVMLAALVDKQFSEHEQKEALASELAVAQKMNDFCSNMKPVLEKTYIELKEWAGKKP